MSMDLIGLLCPILPLAVGLRHLATRTASKYMTVLVPQ